MKISGSIRRPDGARLRFQLDGPRSAPVLLLLQGQANHHGWWDPLRPDFAFEFLTVTMDYRGTGESSVATQGADSTSQWSTEAFAQDVAALLEGANLAQASVYGTSMGGRVAQHLAAQYPHLVKTLVLACTSPGSVIGVERDATVRRSLAHGSEEERWRAMVDLFYRPEWVAAQGGYADVPRALLGDPTMSREARAGHLRTSDTHDASGVLGQIEAPTLIIHGDADLMVPTANSPVLASHIPGARMQLFEQGRHGFFHEMHETVTPIVMEHLQSNL